jgi:membrane associated rhomboid family serine protease
MSYTPKYIVRRHTFLIGVIGVCSLLFLFSGTDPSVALRYGAKPLLVRHALLALFDGNLVSEVLHECLTLLTTIFLHGSFQHVLYNMIYLWLFGFVVSEIVGQGWMAFVLIVTGVCGALAHCYLNPDEILPLIGASGSVMGLEGMYLGMAIRWKLPNPDAWPLAHPIRPEQLAAVGIIGLAFDYIAVLQHVKSNVAYGAHIGGFIVGVFIGSLLIPRPRQILSR